MRTLLRVSIALVSTAALIGVSAACGGDDDDDDSSSSSYTCCVNGAFYVCPSEAALQQCSNDPSACTRTPSRDNECNI